MRSRRLEGIISILGFYNFMLLLKLGIDCFRSDVRSCSNNSIGNTQMPEEHSLERELEEYFCIMLPVNALGVFILFIMALGAFCHFFHLPSIPLKMPNSSTCVDKSVEKDLKRRANMLFQRSCLSEK
jgi:hypothetical protein